MYEVAPPLRNSALHEHHSEYTMVQHLWLALTVWLFGCPVCAHSSQMQSSRYKQSFINGVYRRPISPRSWKATIRYDLLYIWLALVSFHGGKMFSKMIERVYRSRRTLMKASWCDLFNSMTNRIEEGRRLTNTLTTTASA